MPGQSDQEEDGGNLSLPISVIILTINEEKDLPSCLKSLSWCDDIHLVDSGSQDNTVKIASDFGAQVVENPFSSFGQQRNWSLENCSTKHPWILFLDADEHCTPEFEKALEEATRTAPNEVAGFYCCWKMMLGTRWLKRSDSFPKWQFRLLRKGRANFTDHGHGQKEGEIDGRLEYLTTPYLHYAFSKGWTQWFERHNRYSSQEAEIRLTKKLPFSQVFSGTPSQRNPALKYWVSRFPGWPLFRFLHIYLLKGGILEGKEGFVYAMNLAIYEYLIMIKMGELKRGQS